MYHERAYLSWPWRRSPICCEEEREEIWVLGFGLEREEREREKREGGKKKEKRKEKATVFSYSRNNIFLIATKCLVVILYFSYCNKVSCCNIIFFLLQQNVLL
jgi:hypothetical protein